MLYVIAFLFDFYPTFLHTLQGLIILSTVLIIFSIICTIVYFDYRDYEHKTSEKYIYLFSEKLTKSLLKVILILGSIILILPSEIGLASLGAIYINNQIHENINKPEFNQKTYQVLNEQLDLYLEKIKSKSNK